MADGRPAEPDGVDEERLGQAMAALLGGAWPGSGEEGGAAAFTLPPPRRFDEGDQEAAQSAAEVAALRADIWDDPLPGEQTWAPVEPPAPAEAEIPAELWPEPSDGFSADAPAVATATAVPDPWASIDEPTQAHTWSAADDAADDAPPTPVTGGDSGWGEGAGVTGVSEPGDVDEPAPLALAWDGDAWSANPLQPAASGAEPDDQAALQLAGLAGPMNTALSDLRRLGGTGADVTDGAAPALAGAYSSPDRLSELQDWWSDRGRELLPGLAVAAVVVFAFAVVLLGRGSDRGSDVRTARPTVSTVVTPTSTPTDLSAVSEPVVDEPVINDFGDPVFSEPKAAAGSGTPVARKPSAGLTARRPASGSPAAGAKLAPPGGSPGSPSGGSPSGPPQTAPPGPTATTSPPPPTTPTTEPDEPPPTTRDRCELVPQLCEP